MPIIFYKAGDHPVSGILQKIISDELQGEEIITVRDIAELPRKMCRLNLWSNIVVLFMEDMPEFYRVLSIKDSLAGSRIILILPERSCEAVSAGHKLHPRFISYTDGDFRDVAGVLSRMIRLNG